MSHHEVTIEVLNENPQITIVRDFLSRAEANAVIRKAKPHLGAATVIDSLGGVKKKQQITGQARLHGSMKVRTLMVLK